MEPRPGGSDVFCPVPGHERTASLTDRVLRQPCEGACWLVCRVFLQQAEQTVNNKTLLGRAKPRLDMDASSMPADLLYQGASADVYPSVDGRSDAITEWNEGVLSRLLGFFFCIYSGVGVGGGLLHEIDAQ